jgi:hypothetical protein
MQVSSQFQPIFRELGIDGEAVFTSQLIKPWRQLSDRENCTLDATLHDGRRVRWHIKRYPAALHFASALQNELRGHQALESAGIATSTLIAHGTLPDGRGFIIFDDLSGYLAGDKIVESGTSFESLLAPTADLAGRLHRAGLHHRDLYLCHFFAKIAGDAVDVRLIDAARVKQLPRLFTRNRWIVKDLAQFWYSTVKLAVTDEQRTRWLDRYARQSGVENPRSLRRNIERKVDWIGRHDARLRASQPNRNISIPQTGAK